MNTPCDAHRPRHASFARDPRAATPGPDVAPASRDTSATGVLYGIGVGPGSPDLLTLRAVDRLHRADVILAAASPRNEHSLALSIAAPHLRPDVETVRLDFPMTRDRSVLEEAWERNAALAAAPLREGRSAAFLTLGDPLVYSTFGYLLRGVRALLPDVMVDVVPGITSFQAAAARTGTILCEGREALHILPGILERDELADSLDKNGNAVILKTYRQFPLIRDCLREKGRAENAVFVSMLGLEGETITRDLEAVEKPPYLSLILAPCARQKH